LLGLVVANNGDGHLALFLAGLDGLELARLTIEPDLHPTALATDGSGNVFAGFEGGEAALLVSLGLGLAATQGVTGTSSVLLPSGPGEEQVALLLPLSGASALTVATLLSVTPDEFAPARAASNQPFGQGPSDETTPTGADGEADDSGEAVGNEPTPPARGTATRVDPFVEFIAGLDEAFGRARRDDLSGLPDRGPSPPITPARFIDVLDRLLSHWVPEAGATGLPHPERGPVPALEVPLDGAKPVANETRPAQPAIHVVPPSAAIQVGPVGASALGLLALTHTLFDGDPIRRDRPFMRRSRKVRSTP
jgi:hypothetical protein